MSQLFSTKYVDPESNQVLLQPITHTAEMQGKCLWPKLLRALNLWLKAPKDKFQQISNILDMIRITHNVFVDLEENTLTRNGASTSVSVYNIEEARSSVMYASLIILEKVRGLGEMKALRVYLDEDMEFRKGRALEIYWRERLSRPSEEQYFKMAHYKTGSLIRTAISLLQLFSESKDSFEKLEQVLTRLVHVYDDFVTLKSMDEYVVNKSGYDSLSDGRLSFPVLHATGSGQDNGQIIDILRQKTTDPDLIQHCQRLVEQNEGFDYTKQTIIRLKQEAEEEMEKFDENPYMIELFELISSKLNIN